MILACELSFDKDSHVPFNAGVLATIRAAFPKESLSFYGSAAQIEELKKEVGQPLAALISWNAIVLPTPGSVYADRFLRELSILRHLLKTVSPDSTSRLLLTSARPSTVLALKVARCFRSKNPPVQMVLHALNGVVGKRYRRPIRRLQDMKTALTLLGNSGIQYLVLEQPIRDTIVKSFPLLSGKIEALEHPISPNEGTDQLVELCDPIRFGFIGNALKIKGFPLFVEVADAVTTKYGRRAEFHAIGQCPKEGKLVTGTEALATKPASMRMTREEIIRGISSLHFVVLPHEAAHYTHSASGVLLDAITWQKPVIARKIPIFEAMFERHGDIGHLFSDDADLKYTVEQILQAADESRYHAQVLNLRTARKSRTPETLAASYLDICKKTGQVL